MFRATKRVSWVCTRPNRAWWRNQNTTITAKEMK